MESTGRMSSDSGGSKVFSIQGRVSSVNERIAGMTDAERQWRNKFLKEQFLSAKEPRIVPEYAERYNPIRRIYRAPLDLLVKPFQSVLGPEKGFGARSILGKSILAYFSACYIYYYFKYNGNDWTKQGGWAVHHPRPKVYPGQEGYPLANTRTKPSDYANAGFKDCPI